MILAAVSMLGFISCDRMYTTCDRMYTTLRLLSSSLLKKLLWLPVKQRIHYAILLLTLRAEHGQATAYVTDLLHEQRATRGLRLARNIDLYVLPSRGRYGDRTVSVSAPRMCNAHPSEIRTIVCFVTSKRLVKTHLLRVAYAS